MHFESSITMFPNFPIRFIDPRRATGTRQGTVIGTIKENRSSIHDESGQYRSFTNVDLGITLAFADTQETTLHHDMA